ncbi:MAG: hypothetical protein AB3N20_22390 [Rhizobiaceae bacterium]
MDDWKTAINRNRRALGDVVAELLALAQQLHRHPRPCGEDPLAGAASSNVAEGCGDDPGEISQNMRRLSSVDPRHRGGDDAVSTATEPSSLRRSILRILRPAESALRRLIVVVAAMLGQKTREKQRGEQEVEIELPDFSSFATYDTLPAFQLIDPRKPIDGMMRPIPTGIPRIAVPGVFDPVPLPKPDHTLDAIKLMRRIRRLKIALATLPRQARRLNRLMAKRAKAEPGPGKVGPIRPGHPPGHRQRPREPVDDLLRECHWLAMECVRAPP